MAKHQFIVATGASVGGLEALTTFFEHPPLDRVSYVIIPYLSPDFKSWMVEILARHSDLEVLEAGQDMEVETNRWHHITMQPGCEPSINVDRDKIGQVINNLLSIAIKSYPKSRNIEVLCTELPNNGQVSVRDEGIGVT